MRQRDLRRVRLQAQASNWAALEPEPFDIPLDWNDDSQPMDAETYALEAMADANSGTDAINRER